MGLADIMVVEFPFELLVLIMLCPNEKADSIRRKRKSKLMSLISFPPCDLRSAIKVGQRVHGYVTEEQQNKAAENPRRAGLELLRGTCPSPGIEHSSKKENR
jgi:hypothetical protein